MWNKHVRPLVRDGFPCLKYNRIPFAAHLARVTWRERRLRVSHLFTSILSNLLKPMSHQTALPQRLYSALKPCQRAVGSPRNTRKNIKCVSYSVYTTSSQRPYSVHTTFPQRLYSVHDVFTARKQLVQRVHSAHTAFSQRRAHSVLTARTQRHHGDYSVYDFFIYFLLFWVTLFCKHSDLLFTFWSNSS